MTVSRSPNHIGPFAVIPAAGASARMGLPKLLLQLEGATVIEHVLRAWKAGGVEHRFVVVRGDDHALRVEVERCGGTVMIPSQPPPDMKASLLAGLAMIAEAFDPPAHAAVLMAPADLPFLSAEIVARLIAAHDPSSPCAIRPTIAARSGHPVLLPWAIACELKTLGPTEGLKHLLERMPCRDLSCDDLLADHDRSFRDLDTPGDAAACGIDLSRAHDRS